MGEESGEGGREGIWTGLLGKVRKGQGWYEGNSHLALPGDSKEPAWIHIFVVPARRFIQQNGVNSTNKSLFLRSKWPSEVPEFSHKPLLIGLPFLAAKCALTMVVIVRGADESQGSEGRAK